MTLRLSIENMDRLPDGGPLRVQVKNRGLDLGRDSHLDWTLPDPSRHISSKHCEIRFRDGGYWLHDVSTNGTFVNGSQFRLDAPHLLRSGDRLTIGQYIIAVEVEGQSAAAAVSPIAPAYQDAGAGVGAAADIWGGSGEIAAPDDRNAYRPARATAPPPDFLDFASALPPQGGPFNSFDAPAAPPDDAWLTAPAAPPPVAPPPLPAAPSPRRPPPPPAASPFAPPAPVFAPPEAVFAPIDEAAPVALAEPPPAHVATVPPPVAAFSPPAASTSDALARIARAAGIPERALAGRNPDELADAIGVALRLTAANLAQLLASRAETKSLMRSSSRTMIRALENNPLKFTATPEEALAIMFGPTTPNYLDAQTAIERSFADLKAHQMLTYGAMQGALEALFEDFAPEKIESSVEPERGLGALVGSRKAKLWDVYVERWRAKTKRSDGRLSEAFMALFADSYDRLQSRER